MATKFSDFTAQAATGTTFVVGYDGTTNTQYSQDNLTNFVLDGTLSANRLLNFNSNTLQLGNQGTDGGGVKIFQDGRIEIARQSGSFKVTSYGTQLRQNFLRLYSNTTLGATVTGFATLAASSNWTDGGTGGDGFNIGARLGVIGKGNTGVSYGLRVQNSDNEDAFFVRDDKYTVITVNNGIENGFILKNYATYTMLDAGDDGPNSAQMRMYDNSNVRFYFKASQGLMVADTGNNGSSGASSVLTATSNTRGFLPPRNADPASNITTPVAGLVAYDTTDNELQFYNGTSWNSAGGGTDTNIYNTDGDILATRTINDRAGGFTPLAGTFPLKMNVRGSGAIMVAGYANNGGPGTSNNCFRWGPGTAAGTMNVRGNLALDSSGGGAINLTGGIGQFFTVTQSGTTINTNVGIGLTTGVTSRLHIKGSGATFATTSLLVENSNNDDLIKVLDSGRISIGLNAVNSNDGNVVFGNSASASGTTNNSVVIGQNSNITGSVNGVAIGVGATLASGSNSSIAIGPAYINGVEAIAIGNSSRSNIGAVSIGHDSGAENNLGSYNLCLGTRAKNTNNASNVIVLNATGSTTATSGTIDETFSVFMSNASVPDFRVIGAEGMVPPSITTTVRDAISSPISGSTIYNTTDNKLQFYNGTAWTDAGGGGDNIYTADGTLSGNRVVTLGNNTLSFTTAGNGAVKLDSPVSVSRNPSLGVSMYIQGQGATSSTRSLLLENSNGNYMMSVKDDGQITIGNGATIQSTSAPQYSVVIGYGAKDKASAGNGVEAVSIGRIAVGHQNGVAIGGQAKCLGASAVAIGGSAEAKATGVSVGLQAGGPNAGSSAVSIGKFAQAKATGSIAIGTNTGLTGANSIVLNATTGVTSTTTTDTFDVFMTSASTPDLKFRTGDNTSYWNPAGETSAFGFSTTSPTATVDINGTFRLRSATNVSNQILTADSNGNATWSNNLNLNGQVKGGYESSVTTLAFDWNDGNIQKSSATGAQTFSGANAIAGSTYIIMIGTPTVTWGTSVKWPGGTAPTLAGTTNIITLLYDGTSYYATSILNYS